MLRIMPLMMMLGACASSPIQIHDHSDRDRPYADQPPRRIDGFYDPNGRFHRFDHLPDTAFGPAHKPKKRP